MGILNKIADQHDSFKGVDLTQVTKMDLVQAINRAAHETKNKIQILQAEASPTLPRESEPNTDQIWDGKVEDILSPRKIEENGDGAQIAEDPEKAKRDLLLKLYYSNMIKKGGKK